MKHLTFTMMTLVLFMGMPLIASAAMDHSSHDKEMSKGMDHDMKMDKAKEMDHDMHKGHDMAAKDGDFVEIGKDTQNGVVATVKVKTYDEKTKAKMAKMGMNATHHVMVFFTDEKTGSAVASGKAALKIKGEDAKPSMLMLMDTGFGGDVTVEGEMVTFEIGTKLEDGEKRQFSVMFHNM
jgi:hypothetical protein